MNRTIIVLQLLTNLVLVCALLRATLRIAALKVEHGVQLAEAQRIVVSASVRASPRVPSEEELEAGREKESALFAGSVLSLGGHSLPARRGGTESGSPVAGQVDLVLLRALS